MKTFARVFLFVLPLLLAGCETTMQRIAACKAGDWKTIGYDDGLAGKAADFAERKEFCDAHNDDKAKAGDAAAADYKAGWAQGNWNLWAALGEQDGGKGLPSQFSARVADPKADKVPLNPEAYDSGWAKGNSEYWRRLGLQEGTAGKSLQQKDANRRNAEASQLRFDEMAYSDGWHAGNRAFWQDAGMNDAHNGIPDSEFRQRAANARAAGVLVQDEAYHAAWNAEIINYWRNLGAADAVSGKDFGMRRKEAQQKGLKIYESDYRQAWEGRLADYWREAGADDGYGRPFQLEERMASAARDGVFVIPRTRELYTAAWEEQNAKYCVPELAFEQGRRNAGMVVEGCRPELRNQLKHAYLSGQDFEEASARYNQAVADVNDLSDRLHDAYRRLNRLEREIRDNLANKDRPVNDETAKQERRREQERRELAEHIQRMERQLDEARRWADRHQMQMQRLRREIYLN